MHRPRPVRPALAVALALAPPTLGGRARLTAAVAAVSVAIAFASQALRTGGRPLDVLGVVLLVGAAAFLLGRDVALLRASGACLAAAVYAAASYPAPAALLAPAVVLAAAVQVVALPWVAAVGGICLAGALVGSRFGPAPLTVLNAVVALTLLDALLTAADALRVRVRSESVAAECAEQERLRRLAEEKVRIVRDVHTHVATEIARMSRRARLARHLVDTYDHRAPSEARAALEDVTERGHDAMEELRVVAALLHDDSAESLARTPSRGLAAVPELLLRLRDGGLRVTAHGEVGRLPRAVDQAAFEVVNAALDNVVRHSTAITASVTMGLESAAGLDLLAVVVEDPGPARPARIIPGTPGVTPGGLARARARVEVLGGALAAVPDGADGWRVRAVLPLMDLR